MNRKYLFSAVLIAALFLMGFAAQSSSSPAMAQAGPPEGPDVPAADVTSAFTYQGYVQKNSVAINGSCDFKFRLYNASGGGSQVGGLLSRNGQAVSEGRFSSELDFGPNAFDGQGRWADANPDSGIDRHANRNGHAAILDAEGLAAVDQELRSTTDFGSRRLRERSGPGHQTLLVRPGGDFRGLAAVKAQIVSNKQ